MQDDHSSATAYGRFPREHSLAEMSRCARKGDSRISQTLMPWGLLQKCRLWMKLLPCMQGFCFLAKTRVLPIPASGEIAQKACRAHFLRKCGSCCSICVCNQGMRIVPGHGVGNPYRHYTFSIHKHLSAEDMLMLYVLTATNSCTFSESTHPYHCRAYYSWGLLRSTHVRNH